MSSSRAPFALGAALLLASGTAVAQERVFPPVHSFELPEASPRVHGFVGRLISAQRGDSRFGQEHEGEVVLGENFPLVALTGGQRPIVLGFGSQVYGRFSLSDPKSALISTDWVVGFNTTATVHSWALTLEVYHESSHLGDEYGDRFPADRLDWTREVLGGWASYAAGVWRFTAGASYALDDQLRLPAAGGRLGSITGAGHSASWAARCVPSPASSPKPALPPAGGSAPRPSWGCPSPLRAMGTISVSASSPTTVCPPSASSSAREASTLASRSGSISSGLTNDGWVLPCRGLSDVPSLPS